MDANVFVRAAAAAQTGGRVSFFGIPRDLCTIFVHDRWFRSLAGWWCSFLSGLRFSHDAAHGVHSRSNDNVLFVPLGPFCRYKNLTLFERSPDGIRIYRARSQNRAFDKKRIDEMITNCRASSANTLLRRLVVYPLSALRFTKRRDRKLLTTRVPFFLFVSRPPCIGRAPRHFLHVCANDTE